MLVVAGRSNREVADRLTVSVRTVEGHLYRIFAKLGIDDRDQLVHLLSLSNTRLVRTYCSTYFCVLLHLCRIR
jgi:DNA-binding CsgD family transcriptional regulator